MATTSDGVTSPLEGVLVLDAADAAGAYCGRLLADLGAEVVRLEPVSGDPLRMHEPTVKFGPDRTISCFERFVNLNKRSLSLDVSRSEGRVLLCRLVARCDVLIDTPGALGATAHGLTQDDLEQLHPTLVRVSISGFGTEGPYSGLASDDLTTIASGGLLSLAGYEDTPPIAAYGEQTYFARSLSAASGALLALLARQGDGEGRWVDVSGQEAMANALEDALPDYDLNGIVRRRSGDRPREAGTGTFSCADGFVTMVAGRLGTAAAWAALVSWLDHEGTPGSHVLLESCWSDHRYRQSPEAIQTFKGIFEGFASTRTKQVLYREAQQRKIALAPMNDFVDVLGDAQLLARGYFQAIRDPLFGVDLLYPGRPYRMDGMPPLVARPAPAPGEHNEEILERVLGLGRQEVAHLVEVGVI